MVTPIFEIEKMMPMNNFTRTLLLFFFCVTSFAQKTPKTTAETTTYYLVRHAEKDTSDKTNRDPALITIGEQRAENLVSVLQEVLFDAVYSTDYKRTKDTAKPLAEANHLETIIYDIRQFDFKIFREQTKGKTVMIVGHSNTTPFFANSLLGEKRYENLDESVYDNLYIVTITANKTSSILLKIN